MADKQQRNNPTPAKVSFVSGATKTELVTDENPNVTYMTEQMRTILAQREARESLQKSVTPTSYKKEYEGKSDQSKIAFSARELNHGNAGLEEKDYRRLSDEEQKQIAQLDPYVSAIVSTRCNQGSIVGRESDSKFDKGSRLFEINPLKLDDFESQELFKKEQDKRSAQMIQLWHWMYNCGTNNQEVIDTAFAGTDATFKYCTLPEFLSAQIRNLLTFGRCGTQIFRNSEGLPLMWRPVPIETIKNVHEDLDVSIAKSENTADQSVVDADAYNELNKKQRPKAYAQKINGQPVNFFTEDDLKIWNLQKQALFDLNGYPLSPLEQAIYMVFTHQQTLGYLRNQFVKGIGSKGVLCIESTDPSVTLSGEDLEELRRNFHNYLSRNDNSATTPILSGPVKVNYLSLNPTPKDMEFLQVEEHVIRALCSSFQISPHEMGYGHLSQNQGGLTSQNRQEEIVRGEERGLRTLLDVIYDGLNEIMMECFPTIDGEYRLTYVGVGEDTRDAAVERSIQELQTTATMSSLWADSEKKDPIPYGGDVPLAPLFHQNVVKYLKMGIFLEKYFGEEGASKNPEYDFLIDPALEQSRVNRIMLEQQMKQAQQPNQPQNQQQPPPNKEVAKSETIKNPTTSQSLRDEYHGRLEKSIDTYFKAWIKAHD